MKYLLSLICLLLVSCNGKDGKILDPIEHVQAAKIEEFANLASRYFEDKNIEGMKSLIYKVDDPILKDRQSIDRIYMPKEYHTVVTEVTFNNDIDNLYSFPNLPNGAEMLGTMQMFVDATNGLVYFPWYHLVLIENKIYFIEPVRDWID